MAQKDVSEDFSERIANNINDTFYAQGVSWEGKIKNLRTYAEIIVRFILGDENCYLTLGSTDIQNRLKQISTESAFLLSAVNKINLFFMSNLFFNYFHCFRILLSASAFSLHRPCSVLTILPPELYHSCDLLDYTLISGFFQHNQLLFQHRTR